MKMAELLKDGLSELGYKFYANSPTNQQFVIVSDEKLKELDEKYSYEYQMRYNETHSVVRFCTSWATKEENVLALLADMKPNGINVQETVHHAESTVHTETKPHADIYTDGAKTR